VSFFDVRHQNRAHRVIQRALDSRRMPHAYLFAGPEGVGKEMLAMRLAKLLLCGSPRRVPMPEEIFAEELDGREDMPTQSRGHGTREAVDACGQCQDCILVDAGTHPDLFLIYRRLNKHHPDGTIRKQKALVLGVEIIRYFLIEPAGRKPSRGRAKVFVVREAERLNESAQNALLKTLEEPPPDTFIILLTDALDRMLPTTRSRCQQVLFQSLPGEFVADRLKALRPKAGAEQVTYAARHAGGSLGGALRMIDDGLFELKRSWGDRLVKLRNDAGIAPNELAKPFVEDAGLLARCAAERDPEMSDTDASRVGLQMLLAALADFYMDALRRRCGAAMVPVNEDQPAVIDCLSDMSERALRGCLKHLADADSSLGRNANIELTIEAMFIGLSQGRTLAQAGSRAH